MAATAALAALSAAAFAYVTTESLPVGLLQPISHALHSSLVATGRLVTVYAGINVVLSAPLAHLAKGLPRKATICVLMAALVLTSFAAAAAPGYGWLMAVRVVTALGQALFWSLVIPTAASLFPAEMTGRAVGWILGGGSMAVVLGVPAGTWLGQLAGWRAAFIGVGVLAAVLSGSDSAVPAQLPPCRDPRRDRLGARPATLPPRPGDDSLGRWRLLLHVHLREPIPHKGRRARAPRRRPCTPRHWVGNGGRGLRGVRLVPPATRHRPPRPRGRAGAGA